MPKMPKVPKMTALFYEKNLMVLAGPRIIKMPSWKETSNLLKERA